jgi:CarD family transcriptional regulator
MAQKNKAHVKARTSKPAASKTAPRPSKIKTASKAGATKTVAKKPVAASTSHAKKPTAVKPAVAKAPAAKPVAKTPEAKKPAAAVAKPAVRPGHVAVTPARAAAALAKSGQKLTAPVQPATPKDIAQKTAAAQQMLAAQKKSVSQRHGFKTNEFIVYPAHGVGRIVGIEEQEIAGMSLELFVITFDKEKLTLRVPTGKLESVGMRKLADDGIVKKAMETLKGRARVKRTMWSRRAQEYVAKINSGDLISIAEVVRDLYRSEAQPEQSYSERQLYEDALDRMAREIAAVEKLDERGAVQRITDVLSKSARGRRLAEGADSADMRAA